MAADPFRRPRQGVGRGRSSEIRGALECVVADADRAGEVRPALYESMKMRRTGSYRFAGRAYLRWGDRCSDVTPRRGRSVPWGGRDRPQRTRFGGGEATGRANQNILWKPSSACVGSRLFTPQFL